MLRYACICNKLNKKVDLHLKLKLAREVHVDYSCVSKILCFFLKQHFL